MAKRIGTQGAAPFVIQNTAIPAPAGHADHNVGGPFSVPTLADLHAIPEYYLIDKSEEGVERPVWGTMGYVHSDPTPENNGRWELKKGLVDDDITNPDNWQKMEVGSGTSETPESVMIKYESNEDRNAFTDAEKLKLEGLSKETGQTIADKYEGHEDVKRFTTALKNKVDGIETSGDGAKFKANDGTYKEIDALPVQTGNSGKVLKTSGTAASWEKLETSDINSLDTKLAAKESTTNKGVAGGYAPLDATGKLPANMIPDSITGGVTYKGVWDASSGVGPNGTPSNGWYYKVSVAGTTNIDGNAEWSVGDWIIYNGTAWDRIQNSEQISSVQGQVAGDVVITDENVEHQPTIAIPGWIASVYTSGKAAIRLVLDAVLGQVATMKEKLDGIQAEATKNETDSFLRDRDNHIGKDPIESIEGFDEAPNESYPAKDANGNPVWVQRSAPKAFSVVKPTGVVNYYDTLHQAISGADNGDTVEMFSDYVSTSTINITKNITIDTNGHSIVNNSDRNYPGSHTITLYQSNTDEVVSIIGQGKIIRRSDFLNEYSGYSHALHIKPSRKALILADVICEEVGNFLDNPNGGEIKIVGNVEGVLNSGRGIVEIVGDVKGRVQMNNGPGSVIVHGNIFTDNPSYTVVSNITSGNSIIVYGNIIKPQGSDSHPVFFQYPTTLVIGGAIVNDYNVDVVSSRSGSIISFLGPASHTGSIDENVTVTSIGLPPSGIQDIIAGSNISIDKTNPEKPVISSTGGGGTGLTPEQEAKLVNTPLNTNQELQDLNTDMLAVMQDVTAAENAIEGLQKEYVVDIDFEDVESFIFKAPEALKINSVAAQPGTTPTVTGYTVGTNLAKYATFTIEVDSPGMVTLKGELL